MGSQGSKGHFHKKRYFSNRLHGMDMWLLHIYHIDILNRSNRSKNSSGVIWGHRGSEGHFHLKGFNSSMLHSMTIRHIHGYTLETLYLCYGVKCQPGVIWGFRGQKVIFTKPAQTCLYYTAIFLQTSRYRHVSVTVWETGHIKTIRPVQNRGLTWYRRSHMGTLVFNSHCTWTRQCSHCTVQFPQRHVRC